MTTSASKRKGSAFERLVANYVGGKRTYSSGQHKDIGDVHLRFIDELAIFECKDVEHPSFLAWAEETETERRNAQAGFGFLVWKRRKRPVGDALVVTTLRQIMDWRG